MEVFCVGCINIPVLHDLNYTFRISNVSPGIEPGYIVFPSHKNNV